MLLKRTANILGELKPRLRPPYITRRVLNSEHICAHICSVIYRRASVIRRGGRSCARGSGSHLHLVTIRCVRKSLVSYTVPLGTTFKNSYPAFSPQHRASLAAFCYARAHLHDVGLTIAATCEFEELVAVAGSAGHFLFWQSRELSSERKPVALSKQMNVTLASRAPAQ